jgi:uncharacterized protein YutE (UPF0331/DUF86 family)
MTAGGVNLKVVGDGLEIVETCLTELRSLPHSSLAEFLSDRRNPPAAESLVRRAIQALFDVLRHLLAKGSGRGVLEYKELARLAAREGLIRDPHLAQVALQIAGFRNRLVHFYQEVTPEELHGILTADLADIEGLARELRQASIRLQAEG